MDEIVFINIDGDILEIPVKDKAFVSGLQNMLQDDACPLHDSEKEAQSAGDAYDSGYQISDWDREQLKNKAAENFSLWPIIFFLDSVKYRDKA